jgi:hypothetical protein
MPNLPFDLAAVDWTNVGIHSGIVLIAALLGNLFSFGSRLVGAIFTTIFFAVLFVAWTYWLHGIVLPGGAPAAPPV